MKRQTILVIGDLHAPYMHADAVKFLAAVKKVFSPTDVIQIGDEIDGHSLSFHEHDPDLPAPKDELEQARKTLKPLFKLFPKVRVLESNHGSLVYRRAKANGIPLEALKSYREIIKAPKGWTWHFDLIVKTALGEVYFHHGKSGGVGVLSKNMGMSAVQGHFHTKFYVSYWSSPRALNWDANCGCLADSKSMAMAYGKNLLNRPIVGCLIIQNGIPIPIPMVLAKNGRWTGRIA